MRVKWTVEAQDDLTTILAHIVASDSLANAELVVERVLQTERVIELFPRAGTADPATDTYDIYVPKTRIRLTYKITDDSVVVLVAWHTSRDPESKPERS